MRVKGKLTFKCENSGELVNILARSLSPDNVTGIRTEVDKDSATITFSTDKIGTMLSSVDDYLMNAKIAFDMIEKVKNSDQEI
ncbi:MAG: KEOPS complex subunit Pcc1 [Candidatus Methanoperedens sp.]|nr:KEOPS complex subunit Pcc1 [Candidatus Methanoperedens sp.]